MQISLLRMALLVLGEVFEQFALPRALPNATAARGLHTFECFRHSKLRCFGDEVAIGGNPHDSVAVGVNVRFASLM